MEYVRPLSEILMRLRSGQTGKLILEALETKTPIKTYAPFGYSAAAIV